MTAGPPLAVPDPALVVLVGTAGSGKSTFALTHFRRTEVVSSDACRALVADDPEDQAATADAFSLLAFLGDKRLRRGRLTVVDATNLKRRDRRRLLGLARTHGVPAVAIVFAVPLAVCIRRDAARPERTVGREVLARQHAQLEGAMARLPEEEFLTVHVLRSPGEVIAVRVIRVRGVGRSRHP